MGALARARWSVRGALAVLAMPVIVAAAPGTSRANPWSMHAAASVIGAWSDNVANAPEVVPAGQNVPEAGFYTQLRPSGLFTFESPRTVHTVSYALDLALYQTENPPATTSHTLTYGGLFSLAPRTELGLGATLNFGTVSAALTAGAPSAAPQDTSLPGGSQFRSYGLNQALRWEATQAWRLSQGANVSRVDTDVFQGRDAAQTLSSRNHANSLALTLGADRSWQRTALTLGTGVNYVSIIQEPELSSTPEDPASTDQTTRQVIGNVSVAVRRDINPSWAAAASAGLASLTVLESPMVGPTGENATGTVFTPTFSATANYFRPLGSITATFGLTVSKTVAPNLFLGTTTDTTGATLSGAIPLPWIRSGNNPTMQVSGALGLSHSRPLVGDEAMVETTWDAYTADLALSWAPREAMAVSLRYQYADTELNDYDPTMAGAALFQPPVDFRRNTILLQVSGQFPDRQAATLPDRTALRVDRSNEKPVGGDEAVKKTAQPRQAGQPRR